MKKQPWKRAAQLAAADLRMVSGSGRLRVPGGLTDDPGEDGEPSEEPLVRIWKPVGIAPEPA